MNAKAAPFYIDDLAEAHKQGRFVVVNVDHQFVMQHDQLDVLFSDFDDYNRDYESNLRILRKLGVPMIHVAAEYSDFYNAKRRDKDEEMLFAMKLKKFYHNQDTMTVRTPKAIDRCRSYEKPIRTDILHTIKDGEILLYKDFDSVHSNKHFEQIMAAHGWNVPGYAGQYKAYCMLSSMRDSAQKYTPIGFGDMIESGNPFQARTRRVDEMKRYYGNTAPGILMSEITEVTEVLQSRCAPQ